ncbi:MAG: ATP-dependent RNA helicase HrpA [Immundisolibacteraceae bacterium]|nr:ATP-dependent RNA helicase HrpA [Immundisolibacteraceae bacterium]
MKNNPPSAISSTDLFEQLNHCLLKDRHRLKQQLLQHRRKADGSTTSASQIRNINQRIQTSINLAEQRRQSLPAITLPDDLPITSHADELTSAIKNNQVVIIAGETGSGKSTQLPKLCLQAGRGIYGVIGHTQPRRVAARSIANRLSSEMHCELGEQVGYKVRFSDQTSPNSLIKVMTDGILLAETRSDRFLSRYDTIIIDEAHERSLNIDFLLGILKRLLRQRPELKLIITSATIDTGAFSTFFSDAPIFQVSGRGYPVEVIYQPRFNPDNRSESDSNPSEKKTNQPDDLNQGILNAVHQLMDHGPGDILAFLPGEREIVDAQTYIDARLKQRIEIVPLYSRLSQSEQDRIFKQRHQRRLILSTNIAETSLTVPGIHYVIDAGLARISRYSARSKIQQLPIEKISQAAANQRTGRCGRIAPGSCVRLFSEEDFDNRPAQTEPEIVRTNLSTVILQMLNLKLGDPAEFPFIDPPQSRLINDGYQTLTEIGAIDADKTLTEIGRHLAQLPLDPRLGRMLLAAKETGCLQETIVITSGLTCRIPGNGPGSFSSKPTRSTACLHILIPIFSACSTSGRRGVNNRNSSVAANSGAGVEITS